MENNKSIVKKFIKKSSSLLFVSKLIRGLLFSILVSEALGFGLILFSDFTHFFEREVGLWVALGVLSLAFFSSSLFFSLKRPALSEVAKIVDYRCDLKQRLTTAWEYREAISPFIPAMYSDLVRHLKPIKTSSFVRFRPKKNELISLLILSSLLGFMLFVFKPKKSISSYNKQISGQMGMMAEVLDQLGKKEEFNAGSKELSAIEKAADKLRKTEEMFSGGEISKGEAAEKINEIKKKLNEDFLKSSKPKGNEKKKDDEGAIDLGDGLLDELFYKLMSKINKSEFFNKDSVLRDILKIFDSFEVKLKGTKSRKLAKKGEKGSFEISKKTSDTQTVYMNMDKEKAKLLGMHILGEDKSMETPYEDTTDKSLEFYKNYIGSIDSRGELSFVDKVLVSDYFDKVNKP